MIINFAKEPPLSRYHLLTQTVIPRPIAWVLSENDPAAETGEASLNLAPFSFFNAMCSDPPLLAISIGKKPDGHVKDTRHNIMSGRDFVVHIANTNHAAAVNQSAATLAYGESELVASQLALADFPHCSIPRIADCPIAYHCKLYDAHDIGPNQQAIIYAEVMQLYMNDHVVAETNGRYIVDAKAVDPLARLGLSAYADIGQSFNLQRPKVSK